MPYKLAAFHDRKSEGLVLQNADAPWRLAIDRFHGNKLASIYSKEIAITAKPRNQEKASEQ